MVRPSSVLILIVVLSAFSAVAGADLSGMWSGGMGKVDGDRPFWNSAAMNFEISGDELTGEIQSRGVTGKLVGKVDGNSVTFVVELDNRKFAVKGTVEDDVLVGTCTEGSETYDVQLIHENPPTDDEALACVGVYEVAPDHRIAIRKSIHLIMMDYGRGLQRVLYAKGNDTYVTGQRYTVPDPVESIVRFLRADDGTVEGLTIEVAGGKTLRAQKSPSLQTEEYEFESARITLAGTLSLPQSKGPHPAIVWVHGSGRVGREGAGFWRHYFVANGWAFLAVDKRGIGKSEGKYELPNGGHDNRPHMKRRSKDVLAAVKSLKNRKDIDADQIGLVGVSQAGWVMPMAAKSSDVAFTITLSGGATALSIEGLFSRLTGEMDGVGISVDEALEKCRKHRARDSNFRSEFARQKGPGLWLYGGRDRSNPSRLAIELLEGLAKTKKKDFTTKFFPKGNHGLWECKTGGAQEYGTLKRVVPGLYQIIASWLKEKGFGPDSE